MSDQKKDPYKKFLLLIITIFLFILSMYFIYLWFNNSINHQEVSFNSKTIGSSCLGCFVFFAFLCCCPLCIKEFFPKEFKRMMAEPLDRELENLDIDERDLKRIGSNKINLGKNDIETENKLMDIAIEDKTLSEKITELILTAFFLFICFSIVSLYYIFVKKTNYDNDNIMHLIVFGSALFIIILFVIIRLPQILKDKNKSEFTKETLTELYGYFYNDRISITIPSFHKAEITEWTTEKKSGGAYSKVQRLFKFTIIGEDVFKYCINLKSIKFPDTIKEIKKNAFYGCTSLENLVIPYCVTKIGENAFAGVKNINISEAQKTLANYPWGAKKVNGEEP